MIDFIKEASCDDVTGRASSSRVISLMAGSTLSIATLALTFGSFWRPEMLSTLSVFGPFLATLAGANYAMQRLTTGKATTDAA
jgi:hypothetical protein